MARAFVCVGGWGRNTRVLNVTHVCAGVCLGEAGAGEREKNVRLRHITFYVFLLFIYSF